MHFKNRGRRILKIDMNRINNFRNLINKFYKKNNFRMINFKTRIDNFIMNQEMKNKQNHLYNKKMNKNFRTQKRKNHFKRLDSAFQMKVRSPKNR